MSSTSKFYVESGQTKGRISWISCWDGPSRGSSILEEGENVLPLHSLQIYCVGKSGSTTLLQWWIRAISLSTACMIYTVPAVPVTLLLDLWEELKKMHLTWEDDDDDAWREHLEDYMSLVRRILVFLQPVSSFCRHESHLSWQVWILSFCSPPAVVLNLFFVSCFVSSCF